MRVENSFNPVEGVGETTERRLWEAGVVTWDEFDGSVVGPTRAERIRSFIPTARDRLAAGDAGFFADALPSGSQWRLYETFSDDALFLDIETTGLDERRDDVTVVGLYRDGEARALVRGDDLSRAALAAELADAGLLLTFNGRRFDVPFLETSFDLDVDVPHLDLLYPCRQAGLTGGLKAIEPEVGIERDTPDIDGRDAVRLWREHERGRDGALETLLEYNRADVANLETLADRVTARLHDEVFPAPRE